jgi:RNA polymerase sigma-70 factor (ECF subfamily)
MTSLSEAELIEQCCAGDSGAWDELFNRHYAATGRFVFQFSPELKQEDVEEICQEVFLSVIKNLDSFQRGSQLQTWIFRIAANKARDYLEKQRAAKRGGGVAPISLQAEDPNTGLTIDLPSVLPGPDKLLINREGMNLVASAVEQLGHPCREIIELRYFGDLSYDDISRELSLNVKTVSSRLSKCLDQLEKIAANIFCGKKNNPFPV